VINSKDEITAEQLKECSAAGKSISETVWAQLAVIPSLSMRREVRKWFGFYRKDAKSGDDKDAEYREGKILMYGKEEINRLKEFGTTPFQEMIMGCRIDLDCAGWSPKIRQWKKGAEPGGYERKMALPVVDLLKRRGGKDCQAGQVLRGVEEEGNDESEGDGTALYPGKG
jgi:hypothetical protein